MKSRNDKISSRYILHSKKTAFIVEHDFIMATYLADRVVVYDGEPGYVLKYYVSKCKDRK